MKRVWLVHKGPYHGEGWVDDVYATKAGAGRALRVAGYRWNSGEELFLCEDRRMWARLDKRDVHHG